MRSMVLAGPRGVTFETLVPETRRERARGLLGRDGLPEGHAMLFEGARSIHTFGMRFAITVAFLSRDLEVLGARQVAPGRLTLPRLRARHTLECPQGTDLRAGDRLWAP